jgi:hypothetical protein
LIESELVKAEGSVVISLEMAGIELNSFGVVYDGLLEVLLLPICETSVVVEVSLVGLKRDSNGEVFNSFIIFIFSVKGNSSVIVGICVLRI